MLCCDGLIFFYSKDMAAQVVGEAPGVRVSNVPATYFRNGI